MTALLPHAEWIGPEPTLPGEGIWVGFADYNANAWKWYGPFSGSDDWTDTTADSLEGRAGNSFLAVVNYSNTGVEFTALNYQFTSFAQVLGDEWVYFANYDPENPSFGDSISKIRPDGSEQTVVLAGDADVGYSHPRVVNIDGGDPMLVYLMESATEYMIWSQDLGEVPITDLIVSSNDRLEPGGWNPEGTIFYWMQENLTGDMELYAQNSNPVETGYLSQVWDLSGAVNDTTWFGTTYGVICSMYFDTPVPHRNLVIFRNNGPLPINITPRNALPDNGETNIQPAVFSLLNGMGGVTTGFFFASRDRDDESFNIYIHLASVGIPDAPIIPLVVDPTLDFTSPISAINGTHVAFIATDPAENYGTLFVMDLMAGTFETATAIAQNVAGQVSWYDPTP